MTLFELKRRAGESGIDLKTAINDRIEFLHQELIGWEAYMNMESNEIPEVSVADAVKEMIRLNRDLRFVHRPPSKDEVTDEMIGQARAVPIPEIVEFRGGVAKCFAHEDNHPSCYHAKRTNKLACPVCAKTWDTIAIKMERDGLPFREAVLSLC